MLSLAEIERLKTEAIYETPDGGSYSPGLSGLPYKINTPHYEGQTRKELPKMEATIDNANASIDLAKLQEMILPSEIAIPNELQAKLNENALQQELAQRDIINAQLAKTNAELRKELLLNMRRLTIYEFMLAAGISPARYDMVDDLEKGFKFVLKEAKPNDSPPSN